MTFSNPQRGYCMPRALLTNFPFWSLLLIAFSAMAQEGNRDYYAARTPEQANLLAAVEKYHLQPGYDKLAKKHYQAAFGDARFILNYFPNHPRALVLLSDICGRWQSPECNPDRWIENAVSRNPSVAATHVIYGIYLHRAKRFEAAVTAYKQALDIDPMSVSAHYNLGLSYVELKQFELANQHAQKSYALGAPFPGLREKLKQVGFWKPSAIDDAAPKGAVREQDAGQQ